LMETHKPLLKDVDGEDVDEHLYRSMIGSLMYLTSSRPDIMFSVCQPKLGLWYPKDSPFDLVAYTDSDYAGSSLDRKSITAEYIAASNCYGQTTAKVKTINGEVQMQALVDGKKVIVTETSVRIDLRLEDAEGTDCLPTAIIFEELERMGAKTTAWNEFSSTMASAIILFLDKQVKGMSKHKEIYVTPSHTKKVFAKREGKGFFGRVISLFSTMMVQAQQEEGEGSAIPTDPHPTPSITQPSSSQPQKKQKPRRKQRKGTEIPLSSGEPMADEAANKEHVPTYSNDPLLSETSKAAAQAQEISSLKQIVKKLEKKKKSRPHGLRRLYKVGRSRRVESSEESLGDQEDASGCIQQGRKVDDLNAEQRKLRLERPKAKAKSITFREPGESTTRTTPTPIPSNIKNKGKAKMIEPKKPLKEKEQIRLDEELTLKQQVEEKEEDRLARERLNKMKMQTLLNRIMFKL
ncbi:hypothetical protein Tco_1324692, partial [Tanacetum coccineum]